MASTNKHNDDDEDRAGRRERDRTRLRGGRPPRQARHARGHARGGRVRGRIVDPSARTQRCTKRRQGGGPGRWAELRSASGDAVGELVQDVGEAKAPPPAAIAPERRLGQDGLEAPAGTRFSVARRGTNPERGGTAAVPVRSAARRLRTEVARSTERACAQATPSRCARNRSRATATGWLYGLGRR